MPFTMASHYKHQRDNVIGTYTTFYLVASLISYYCAFVVVVIPYYCFSISNNGRNVDIWEIGYLVYVCLVLFSHGIFWCIIRNVTK